MNNITGQNQDSTNISHVTKGSFAITDILETSEEVIFPDPMLMLMAIDVPYSEMKALPRMACYLRYSSSNQTILSTKGQFADVVRYCRLNKILITAIYKDEAISGTHSDRMGYQRLQDDIVSNLGTEKDIEAVLVYKSDRQARNPLIALQFEAFLQSHGKYMISTTESEFFNKENSSNGELMKMIKIGFNSFYSKQLSELVIRGKHIATVSSIQAHGISQHNGGNRILGYNIVNKLPVINEFEAPIIREMFERFSNGETYRQLREFLKESGMLPTYYYKHGQAEFTTWSISDMLRNPKYAGIYVQGSRKARKAGKHYARTDIEGVTVYENGWPAIIDKELFDRTQERLNKRSNHEKKANGANYVLTGYVKCEKCGMGFCGRTATKTNKNGTNYSHRSYRCSSYSLDRCKCKSIGQDILESMVFKTIHQEFYVPNAVKKITAYIESQNNNTESANNPKYKPLLTKIGKLKVEIQQLVDSIAKFTISQELINAISTQVKEKEDIIKEHEATLEKMGYDNSPKTYYETSERQIEKILRYGKIDSDEVIDKKNLMLHFVDSIVVGDDSVTINLSFSKFITNYTRPLVKKICIPRVTRK